MRKKICILLLTLFPFTALADCNKDGSTIVWVNGILTSQQDADEDTIQLTKVFLSNSSHTDTKIVNGYNPSHLAGFGDKIESVTQAFNAPISDYDFKTIL